jgi:hypothetical protein
VKKHGPKVYGAALLYNGTITFDAVLTSISAILSAGFKYKKTFQQRTKIQKICSMRLWCDCGSRAAKEAPLR